MSALSHIQMRPVLVRIALLVGNDTDVEEQLRNILKPGLWALKHAPNNAAALVMAVTKNCKSRYLMDFPGPPPFCFSEFL